MLVYPPNYLTILDPTVAFWFTSFRKWLHARLTTPVTSCFTVRRASFCQVLLSKSVQASKCSIVGSHSSCFLRKCRVGWPVYTHPSSFNYKKII